MPTFYAHQRFGACVLRSAPPAIQSLCEKHRTLFDIGLQGPDIFAFFNPLKSNPVSAFADECHRTPGYKFLPDAAAAIRTAQDRDAAMAYFCGFLCHLALDSVCHPYVYEAMRITNRSHAAVETSFDCSLFLADSMDPFFCPPAKYIKPSTEAAKTIAAFFSTVNAKEVEKCLHNLTLCGRLLYIESPLFRKALHLLFFRGGRRASISGMLMTAVPDPACKDTDRHLKKLLESAVPLALELIAETHIYIESEKPVGNSFRRTFTGPLQP